MSCLGWMGMAAPTPEGMGFARQLLNYPAVAHPFRGGCRSPQSMLSCVWHPL